MFESNVTQKDSNEVFDRNEQTKETDNVVLSYCDMNIEVDEYHDISSRFTNLCRICGELSVDGIKIFATKGVELKLKEKMNLHLPITMEMGELMPQKLCMSCYNKLEIAHSLVITSLRTDMKLKKFLNINEELNYDNRYNTIVKKCALEMAEEICTNKEITSVELSSNNIEEITSRLNQLQHTSSVNDTGNEMQPGLSNFIETNNKQDEEKQDESMKITCLHSKRSFVIEETLDNYKIYDGKEAVVQDREVISNNTNNINKDSDNVEITNFQFISTNCDICHKNFKDEKYLAEHKLLHCKIFEIDQCKISNKPNASEEQCSVYKNLYNANNIMPVETNKKCGHCNTIYSTRKELLNHSAECHKGQLLFKCIICDKSYEKWSSLDVHEATHRIDKPYLCDLCGKSFKHSNNLRGHKRTHLDDSKKKRHVCEICENRFRSRFHLGEHMNQHNGNKPHSCDKCNKTFYKRIQLRQHKLSHDLSKHICPICGTAFNRKGNMNTHLKRHSNGNDTYSCSVCGYRCKSMSELKLHRKKHTEEDIANSIRKKCINKTIWQCKSCNRLFSTQTLLLNHEHFHKRENMCTDHDICGKKLASKNSLIYHKNSMHSTERPHMCQYCGEPFVFKAARPVHERIHTGERPYVCKVCNMQYKYMKIHSDVKPYKCFTRKGALNVQKRIHTGEKPFFCDTCGRTFSQKDDMVKHTRIHQMESLYCEQCDETIIRKKDILNHVALHKQSSCIIQEYVGIQQQEESYNVDIRCSQFELFLQHEIK